jgi:hypothetical protein
MKYSLPVFWSVKGIGRSWVLPKQTGQHRLSDVLLGDAEDTGFGDDDDGARAPFSSRWI